MANSFEKYEIKGYEVRDDFEILFTEWELNDKTYALSEKLDKVANSAESSGYDRITKAIKKYPHIPVFKYSLATYYIQREEFEKADECIDKLLIDHPNFLKGYISKALFSFGAKEYVKIPGILGENFDLKELFPSRDVFHIEEFIALQYAAVLYFSYLNESRKAWDRLRIMEEIGPDKSPTLSAREFLTNEDFEDFEDEMMGNYISPYVPEQPITTKTEIPEYNHERVKELYFHLFDEFPDGLISEISELPRESLIEDLETMINDSFERFTYLTQQDWVVEQGFVTHAIFMLAEKNAIETAPLIYKVLSQSYEYLDWFLGVVFEHDLFDPFYKLLAGEPEEMVEFIKKPGVGNMPRIMMLSLIKELALQDKTKKLVAINYLDQLLDFFITAKPEDNVFDNMVMDGVVVHLMLLGAEHTLPKIKYVLEEGMLLNYADVPFEAMKHIAKNPRPTEKLQLLSMDEAYSQIDFDTYDPFDEYEEEFGGDFEFPDDFEIPDGVSEEQFIEAMEKVRKSMEAGGSLDDLTNGSGMTVVKSPKPGRNEPCHCGSGKKYKKCCLGKDE